MSKCGECSAFFICYDKGGVTSEDAACVKFEQRPKAITSITNGDRVRLMDNDALAKRFVHKTKAVDSHLALFTWAWCPTREEAIASNKHYLDEAE